MFLLVWAIPWTAMASSVLHLETIDRGGGQTTITGPRGWRYLLVHAEATSLLNLSTLHGAERQLVTAVG